MCLTLRLPSGHLLLVCGIYHPPKPAYRPVEFLQYVVNFMDNALDQHPGLTIVTGGDVNHLDVNELCLLTGWNALVDFPRRGDAFLDNVFTNRQDLFEKCYPFIISTKTDHTAVVLSVGKKLKPIRQKVRIRDSRKHRKDALYLALVKENWSSVCDSMDVNEAVNNLETIIHKNMDICIPLKTVTVSSRDPSWITPLVKSLIRRKTKKIGSTQMGRLQEIKLKINYLICENRRNLLNAPVVSKEWWKQVDDLSQHRHSSAKVSLGTESLQELNDYFADLCRDPDYKEPTPAEVCEEIQAPEISERHVRMCLQYLKKTATGPDLIPYWIWKNHAEILAPIIYKIWNLSMSSNWPSSWKISPRIEVNTEELAYNTGDHARF